MIQIIRNITSQIAAPLVLSGKAIITIDQDDINDIIQGNKATLLISEELASVDWQTMFSKIIAELKRECVNIKHITRMIIQLSFPSAHPLYMDQLSSADTLMVELNDLVKIIFGLTENATDKKKIMIIYSE